MNWIHTLLVCANGADGTIVLCRRAMASIGGGARRDQLLDCVKWNLRLPVIWCPQVGSYLFIYPRVGVRRMGSMV